MHELLRLLGFIETRHRLGQSLILATIVATKGSSYRKTGTQMVIAEDFSYEGHLSGGCVEKEVLRQCEIVFRTGKAIEFEYDGTYRLGCKGIITVFLEPVSSTAVSPLAELIRKAHHDRRKLELEMYYSEAGSLGTAYRDLDQRVAVSTPEAIPEGQVHSISILPTRQLFVIGSEFDAGILANMAALTGFETTQVVHQHFPLHNQPAAYTISALEANALIDSHPLDQYTAVILMTHSYTKDLSYLVKLIQQRPLGYLGVLGPGQRKEDLIIDLIEKFNITDPDLLESLRGPIGLRIGSKTPEEIAVSIVAELVQVFGGYSSDKRV